MDYKELWMEVHGELAADYLKLNPGATEDEAYKVTEPLVLDAVEDLVSTLDQYKYEG